MGITRASLGVPSTEVPPRKPKEGILDIFSARTNVKGVPLGDIMEVVGDVAKDVYRLFRKER